VKDTDRKVWLITGSSAGLGRHLAEAVLAKGDLLVATARNPARLASLRSAYGDRVASFELDVTDPAAAHSAVQHALEVFGRIDVLVNNAGYADIAPFEQMPDADFQAVVDTNFYGVVNLSRAVVPVMRAKRSGLIINISSSAGRVGHPGSTAYCAAKFAVGGFSEALGKEVSPFGVRVVAVEPGSMRTDWTRVASAATTELLPDYQPTIGKIIDFAKGFAGHEPGDPHRYAAAIFALARAQRLPEHLVLGPHAVSMVEAADDERRKCASEWLPVSLSTDFEGAEMPDLGKLVPDLGP
jgi:NAD(P)-dependent dehydrogenase (short-subunit alcohol dehydrogenase family)